VLYQRLGELTEACLVARDAGGRYLLTDISRSLSGAIEPLDSWARTWAAVSSQGSRKAGQVGSGP
jgi:DNA-binding HxlR family transcriptional regulator